MPLETERSFTAESAVGRYWLLNCVGFRVEGSRRGIVEEVGLGPHGVDVLAVRRRFFLGRRVVLVPTQRVESIHPWDDTIVLASRRRRARDGRAVQAQRLQRRLQRIGGSGAVASGHLLRAFAVAVRDGTVVVIRLLAAFATLLARHAPQARRVLLGVTAMLLLLLRAYVTEARRALRAQRDAIAAWQEQRRELAEEPGDDGPLTRAGAEELDARRRETIRG